MSNGRCEVVGTPYDQTKWFREALERDGTNLCDSCPFADCVASQQQSMMLNSFQDKYRKTHRPDVDKRVIATRERLLHNMKRGRFKDEYSDFDGEIDEGPRCPMDSE